MPALKPGYYLVAAKAVYNGSNYTAEGLGVTQIYVAPYSLNLDVNIYPKEFIFQNQDISITANITYPNGTPVRYGTFSAIIIPSYLSSNFDNLQLEYSVPLTYVNGSWVGVFKIPNGASANSLGYSTYGISGYWYVYVEGISSEGLPVNFPASLNVNSLSINPLQPSRELVVLPYVYVEEFNGTLAFNEYINKAIIIDHNATFINSVIANLIVKNGSVTLINSKVFNISLANSKLININSTFGSYNTISNQTIRVPLLITSNNNELLIIGIIIDIITIVLILTFRKRLK